MNHLANRKCLIQSFLQIGLDHTQSTNVGESAARLQLHSSEKDVRSSIRKPIVNTYGSLYRQYLSALKPPLFYKSLLAAVAIIFSVPVDSRAEVNEVEAVQHGRSLLIFGDENNNAIQIGQFDTGDIVVQGIECDGHVTEVNGEDELAEFSNVQNIFVKLGDGDDCVAASNELSLLSDCLNLGKGYFGESEFSVDLYGSIFISGELEIFTGAMGTTSCGSDILRGLIFTPTVDQGLIVFMISTMTLRLKTFGALNFNATTKGSSRLKGSSNL